MLTIHFYLVQTNGKISWDYSITSVPIYLYPDGGLIGRAVLDVICLAFLVINTCLELKGRLLIFLLIHDNSSNHTHNLSCYGCCRCDGIDTQLYFARILFQYMECDRLVPFLRDVAGLGGMDKANISHQ